MRNSSRLATLLLLLAASVIAAGRAEAGLFDGLPEQVRAAKEDFRPLTAADVASAKADVAAALSAVKSYLAPAGANGQAWWAFLQLDDLQQQLN